MFVCRRFCGVADGHDGSDERAEPHTGDPVPGVQAVRHAHLLSQGTHTHTHTRTHKHTHTGNPVPGVQAVRHAHLLSRDV
jgi:hypothetical protein